MLKFKKTQETKREYIISTTDTKCNNEHKLKVTFVYDVEIGEWTAKLSDNYASISLAESDEIGNLLAKLNKETKK